MRKKREEEMSARADIEETGAKCVRSGPALGIPPLPPSPFLNAGRPSQEVREIDGTGDPSIAASSTLCFSSMFSPPPPRSRPPSPTACVLLHLISSRPYLIIVACPCPRSALYLPPPPHDFFLPPPPLLPLWSRVWPLARGSISWAPSTPQRGGRQG